ncbi:hypothetical protein F5888DRAFT_1888734, partial [Russula emetica]
NEHVARLEEENRRWQERNSQLLTKVCLFSGSRSRHHVISIEHVAWPYLFTSKKFVTCDRRVGRNGVGKGSSPPPGNTRQTYVYLQPHHLHRYSIVLTLLACLVSRVLPLFFDVRNELAKVQ